MSSKIKILADNVINKIAAGEVVERPSSVVKELIENSLDAGSTEIVLEIEQAGRRLIKITDNGSGMSKEDARLAFARHATSKITNDSDLEAVRTMGFRGEALSSVASVSQVRMLSMERGAATGVVVEIEGGEIKSVADAAAATGTSLEIAHLFYNTPARLKFLKSAATEFSHIVTAVSRQALAHAGVRFKLLHNKKPVLELPASSSIRERVFQIYGSDIADNLIEFSAGRDPVRIHGLLSRPGYTRADKTCQDFFVNSRAIRNASLTHAIYSAYNDMLMRDRHPAFFVFVEIDPALVDVNVHPAKAEVRFRNQSQVHDFVRDAVREGLRGERAHSVPFEGTHAARVEEALSDYLERSRPGTAISGSTDFFRQTAANSLNLPYASPGSVDGQFQMQAPLPSFLYPLAQIHDSFILAQSQEGLAIIDQHAAHERVLFEKLQDQYGSGSMPVQDLLVPLQLDLGRAHELLFAEYLQELAHLGFVIDDFGKGTFIVRSVPSLLTGSDYKQLLLDIIDEVNVHGKSAKMDRVRDEILSVMACHPAIKINRRLQIREMEQLLGDLFACRMPHTCPHGRPTIIRFSMHEIRKMFKRV